MRTAELVLAVLAILLALGLLIVLRRVRMQADAAQARASEVDRLAALGAETLNAARAEDALTAVAGVIRAAVRADWCAVYEPVAPTARADNGTDDIRLATASPTDAQPSADRQLVQWVVQQGAEAAVLADNTIRVAAGNAAVVAPNVGIRVLLLPLQVRGRIVGVLAIGAARDLDLGHAQRRVLRALSHYAALGVERVRLVGEADHAEALREADRLKDALLASVSHDLRTPLTTIKALANEIVRGGDERAAMIEEEADRLNRFVGQLLDLSRAQAGASGQHPEPNEAEDLVGAALQRIAGRADGREIRTTFPASPEVLLIGRFDFADTLRALVNLLDNALKYSPPATAIDLSVRREGPWLVFTVADRGSGVPLGERERIFEPFYRPSGTPADAGGAGLGLTIARRLAEAQRGSVMFEPRPGGGSAFTLRVPALDIAELVAP